MQTRPARQDRREVDLRRLVSGFLRMAPDIAVVGEVRDKEGLPGDVYQRCRPLTSPNASRPAAREPSRRRFRTLADLLRRLNPALRGWCNYFRQGVSGRTFSYVDHFAFWGSSAG